MLRAVCQCRHFQHSLRKRDRKGSERLRDLPKVIYGSVVESGPQPIQRDSRAHAPEACVLWCFHVARNGKWIVDEPSFSYQVEAFFYSVCTRPGPGSVMVTRAGNRLESALASGGLYSAGERESRFLC